MDFDAEIAIKTAKIPAIDSKLMNDDACGVADEHQSRFDICHLNHRLKKLFAEKHVTLDLLTHSLD